MFHSCLLSVCILASSFPVLDNSSEFHLPKILNHNFVSKGNQITIALQQICVVYDVYNLLTLVIIELVVCDVAVLYCIGSWCYMVMTKTEQKLFCSHFQTMDIRTLMLQIRRTSHRNSLYGSGKTMCSFIFWLSGSYWNIPLTIGIFFCLWCLFPFTLPVADVSQSCCVCLSN